MILSSGASEGDLGGSALFRDGAHIVCGERSRRVPPKELQDRLTRVGGKNPYGEPNLRIIWGWEPTQFIWDPRSKTYEHKPPYFAKLNRWHIERWFPPEYYGSPDTWRWDFTQNVDGKEIDLLGPYPDRGGYEHVATVERRHQEWCPTPQADLCFCGGGYVALTPDICDELVNRLRLSREVRAGQRHADVVTKIENEWTKDDAHISDVVDDRLPPFYGSRPVYIGNKNNLPVRGPAGQRSDE